MKRTVAAFLIAPLVPPVLAWLLSLTPTLAALPGFMLDGGVIGYIAIAIVGVPAYALITTYARLRAAHVLSIAVIVGAGTTSLMSPVLEWPMLGLGALFGLSAGVTFWLIWRRPAAR